MALRMWTLAALTVALVAGTTLTVEARNNSKPTEIVQSALQSFERKDLAALERLLAPNARFDNMLLLPNMPGTFQGREAVMQNFQRLLGTFERIEFVDERVFPSQDGRTVFVEARGNFVVKGTGQPYRNIYVFAFEVVNGQVVAVREYTNPLTIAETFKIPLSQPASQTTR